MISQRRTSKPGTRKCSSPVHRQRGAIADFAASRNDLVLGGTFADLPLARQAKLPAGRPCASIRRPACSGWSRLTPAGRSTIPRCASCSPRRSTGPISSPRLAFPGSRRARPCSSRASTESRLPPPRWFANSHWRPPAGASSASRPALRQDQADRRVALPAGPGARPAARASLSATGARSD